MNLYTWKTTYFLWSLSWPRIIDHSCEQQVIHYHDMFFFCGVIIVLFPCHSVSLTFPFFSWNSRWKFTLEVYDSSKQLIPYLLILLFLPVTVSQTSFSKTTVFWGESLILFKNTLLPYPEGTLHISYYKSQNGELSVLSSTFSSSNIRNLHLVHVMFLPNQEYKHDAHFASLSMTMSL